MTHLLECLNALCCDFCLLISEGVIKELLKEHQVSFKNVSCATNLDPIVQGYLTEGNLSITGKV